MMHTLDKQSGTWKWGIFGLALLAPFFFLSYGFANHYAASLKAVPSIMFAWEADIPLWPWSIVPYWSIDLFYGLSLLLCWNKFELKQQMLRLFSAQIIAVSCFLLFPLKFSLVRPELSGFFGLWFDVLMGFDRPFNQAPSLHIVLLVILWDFYRRHVNGSWKLWVDCWSFLIGLSVLTTWQHHFIDIPTGILVGAFCLWLFPLQVKAPYSAQKQPQHTKRHARLALLYSLAAILLYFVAYLLKGWTLWLLYPSLSLILVACAYVLDRPHFFQKDPQGQISAAAQILFAPYFLCAWLNSRIWTKAHPEDSFIVTLGSVELYLGRIPSMQHAKSFDALFDCCAELPRPNHPHHYASYSLDLTTVLAMQLQCAVNELDYAINALTHHTSPQKILVFCALGYSRSSCTLVAWLLTHHNADSVAEAISIIQNARPWIVINPAQQLELEQFHLMLQEARSC